MKIGEVLKKLRKKNGLTQNQVSLKSGFTQAYISQVESGRHEPSNDFVKAMGKIYDVPFEVIVFLSLEMKEVKRGRKKIFKLIHEPFCNMIEELLE